MSQIRFPTTDTGSGLLVPSYAEITPQASAPAAPSSGKTRLYLDSNGVLQLVPASGGVARRPVVHWGSVSAWPTGAIAGDVCARSDVGGCTFIFDGTSWWQEGTPTFANRAALPAASGLYDGFTAYVTSKGCLYRVWNVAGTLKWAAAVPYGQIFLTAQWTVPQGDQGVAGWPTVAQWDTDNMWTGLAYGSFAVPVPGVYRCSAYTTIGSGSTGNTFVLRISKNPATTAPYLGSSYASDNGLTDSTNGDEHRTVVTDLILAAGDRIGLTVYASVAGMTMNTAWGGTWLTVAYVGATPSASNVA